MTTEEQPLAEDLLARLRRIHGSLRPGDTLIGDFLTDAEHLVDSVRGGLDSGDHDGAGRAAHKLAGSAGMFAAELVSRLAAELEEEIVVGDMQAAKALVPALAFEMARASDALRREFPSGT
jgi:HPt (histidine-containing phosphotransfer) domain-containing protein